MGKIQTCQRRKWSKTNYKYCIKDYIVKIYPNGVCVGNIPDHSKNAKKAEQYKHVLPRLGQAKINVQENSCRTKEKNKAKDGVVRGKKGVTSVSQARISLYSVKKTGKGTCGGTPQASEVPQFVPLKCVHFLQVCYFSARRIIHIRQYLQTRYKVYILGIKYTKCKCGGPCCHQHAQNNKYYFPERRKLINDVFEGWLKKLLFAMAMVYRFFWCSLYAARGNGCLRQSNGKLCSAACAVG